MGVIIRLTPPSRPNTVGLKCPPARLYVRPSPWAITWRCFRDPTLAVLVQYRRVTDGRTDTRRQYIPRALA